MARKNDHTERFLRKQIFITQAKKTAEECINFLIKEQLLIELEPGKIIANGVDQKVTIEYECVSNLTLLPTRIKFVFSAPKDAKEILRVCAEPKLLSLVTNLWPAKCPAKQLLKKQLLKVA